MGNPEPAPFDPCNALLGEQPAQIATALIPTPAGQRLVMTVRTPSASLTVFLGREDALTWAKNLKDTAERMSSAGLVIPGGMPGPNGRRH